MTEDESASRGQANPPPTEGGMGFHVGLSIALIVATVGVIGAEVLEMRNAVEANFYLLAFLQGIVVLLLLLSAIFGGKGIQAAGRFTGATAGDEKIKWRKKASKRFSYQALILVPAALVWIGSLFLPPPQSEPETTEIPQSAQSNE